MGKLVPVVNPLRFRFPGCSSEWVLVSEARLCPGPHWCSGSSSPFRFLGGRGLIISTGHLQVAATRKAEC